MGTLEILEDLKKKKKLEWLLGFLMMKKKGFALASDIFRSKGKPLKPPSPFSEDLGSSKRQGGTAPDEDKPRLTTAT